MTFGIKQKLFAAFCGLYLLLVLTAALALTVIGRVSQASERIFHENLQSIRACQDMRLSLERMNESLLSTLWDSSAAERAAPIDPDAVPTRRPDVETGAFEASLRFQQGNVTVAGESALTDSLALEWRRFRSGQAAVLDPDAVQAARRDAYARMIPGPLHRVQDLTRRIADLNAENILSVDGRAKSQARSARITLVGILAGGGALTLLLLVLAGRSILGPVRALLHSAQEIERGNLDLVLEVRSHDELGRLAEAFNAMAARLLEFRRIDRAKLAMTQKTTQMAIDSLPDAVAVFGAGGTVEMSNPPAETLFGIKPGAGIENLGMDWLTALLAKVRGEMRPSSPRGYEGAVQVFRAGEERFFLPQAIPVLDESGGLFGVTVVLADVTELRRLDEAKSDLLATVSHEFKTRLTSVRMAVHLLLDEKIGEVNARQAELLTAAREDAERLHRLIEGLLDIGRIRSGRLEMETRPMRPVDLIRHSADGARQAFQEKGLRLEAAVPEGLPEVLVDPARAFLVLDNLLSNALKYTPAGGNVKVTAEAGEGEVVFRVGDTGTGISEADLPRIFDRFYRGSSGREGSGAGLGLAIAREVAEAHGGSLTVESEEGKGSTFSFALRSVPGKA